MTKKREEYVCGDKVERQPPARRVGVVISVLLSGDDFDLISRSAEQTGMRMAEFIKKAALDAAKHESTSLPGGGAAMNDSSKPEVVQAFQMTSERISSKVDWPEWLIQAWEVLLCRSLMAKKGTRYLTVLPNDWIILGALGELYTCKPDVFEATYEVE